MQEAGKAHAALVAEALQSERESSRQAIETALEEQRQNSAKQMEELKVCGGGGHVTLYLIKSCIM